MVELWQNLPCDYVAGFDTNVDPRGPSGADVEVA